MCLDLTSVLVCIQVMCSVWQFRTDRRTVREIFIALSRNIEICKPRSTCMYEIERTQRSIIFHTFCMVQTHFVKKRFFLHNYYDYISNIFLYFVTDLFADMRVHKIFGFGCYILKVESANYVKNQRKMDKIPNL